MLIAQKEVRLTIEFVMKSIHLNLFHLSFSDPAAHRASAPFGASTHLDKRVEGCGLPPLNRAPLDDKMEPENLLGT
jgi:hypothetical protein